TANDNAALNVALHANNATLAQYTAAGITGVTASNLKDVTAAVKAGKTVGTDLTKTQIQTLVDTELVLTA
uniref:hypothetical protein n=1 Tax=Bacillus velezensis TaxID=492670 RepID=UPI0020C162E0